MRHFAAKEGQFLKIGPESSYNSLSENAIDLLVDNLTDFWGHNRLQSSKNGEHRSILGNRPPLAAVTVPCICSLSLTRGGREEGDEGRRGGKFTYLSISPLLWPIFALFVPSTSSHLTLAARPRAERDAHHLPRKRDGEEKQAKKGGIPSSPASQAPFLYFIFILAAPPTFCFSRPNTNCSLYHITAGLLLSRDKKMGAEKPVCATPPPKKKHKKMFYSFYVYFYTGNWCCRKDRV